MLPNHSSFCLIGDGTARQSRRGMISVGKLPQLAIAYARAFSTLRKVIEQYQRLSTDDLMNCNIARVRDDAHLARLQSLAADCGLNQGAF